VLSQKIVIPSGGFVEMSLIATLESLIKPETLEGQIKSQIISRYIQVMKEMILMLLYNHGVNTSEAMTIMSTILPAYSENTLAISPLHYAVELDEEKDPRITTTIAQTLIFCSVAEWTSALQRSYGKFSTHMYSLLGTLRLLLISNSVILADEIKL
jgi:hypothetical protein